MIEKRFTQLHTNDCFRAAMATILQSEEGLPKLKGGVQLGSIHSPNSRWSRWAKENGYRIEMWDTPPRNRYYIGNYWIAAFDNTVHSVVCYNARVVHNPGVISYTLGDLFNAVWLERD